MPAPVSHLQFSLINHLLATVRSSTILCRMEIWRGTAQTALRQSNAAFTLNRYTQADNDELVAAQNMMLDAIFNTATEAVQLPWVALGEILGEMQWLRKP